MSDANDKNRKTALIVFGGVFAMIGLSFASVPLYNIFCSVTGYGGTTQVGGTPTGEISDRIIKVNFDGATASTLPWEFAPEQHVVETHPGQKTLISYRAKNLSQHPVTGTALYNVSPPKAGKYFHKIECFCFGEQTLAANQETDMPVLFYIDPSINDDPAMKDVSTITLSYTFYRTESPEYDKGLEKFYNAPEPPAQSGAS